MPLSIGFILSHSLAPQNIPLGSHPHIFAPLRSPMKTLETARTADCCDPTGGRLRSPGLYPVFSFVLRRASKLPCFRSQWFGGAGTIPCFRGGHTGHTLFVAASAVLVLPSLPKPQTNHSQAATCDSPVQGPSSRSCLFALFIESLLYSLVRCKF